MMGGRILPVADGAYGVFAMFSFRPGDDAGPPPRPLVRLGRDGSASDTALGGARTADSIWSRSPRATR